MKYVLWLGRVLIAAIGVGLGYVVVLSVQMSWQARRWEDLAAPMDLINQSLVVSLPAVAAGIIVTAIWPRLWPLPTFSFLAALAAIILTEPSRFDFLFQALL